MRIPGNTQRWMVAAFVTATAAFAARPALAQHTSVFTYYGSALHVGGAPADGYVAIIRNTTRDDTVSAVVGTIQSGKYQVTVIDFVASSAATIGDVVEITLNDGGGSMVSGPVEHVLGATDILEGRLRTDLTAGAPDVVVVAPAARIVDPGAQGDFEFFVYNTGDIPDSYTLSVTVAHPEWIQAYPAVVGPVPAGEFVSVTIMVAVPEWIDWPVYEIIELEACSQVSPSVCFSDVTHTLVPTAVTSSSVRYDHDHVAVEWVLSEDVAASPFVLYRRDVEDRNFLPLGGAVVESRGFGRIFYDRDVGRGHTYEYMLEIDAGTVFAISLGRAAVPPAVFFLEQNYPNPFNPRTRIRVELDTPADVRLSVYDVAGRPVRTLFRGSLGATSRTFEWDGTDDRGLVVASGVYFCRLVAGGRVLTRRMVLLK